MTYPHTHAAGRRTGTSSRHGGRSAAPVPPQIPDRRGPGGRRLLGVLLLVGLVASVLPWWLGTPAGSLRTTAATVTAAGRITGLIAGYLLLVQVLMMSRLPVLERWIGGEQMARWHRDIGATLLVAVLAHVSLILVGYADLRNQSVLAEVGTLLGDYEDMVSAFVAAGIMVLVGFSSIRAIRRALPYELWHLLHLSSYLVLLLGFGHQFTHGAQLYKPGPVRTGWIALYLLVVAALLWGRRDRAAGVQPALQAAGRRRGRREPGHHLHLPHRRAARPAGDARRPVLPLAVPHPGLLVAVAPVLASRPPPTAAGCGSPSRWSARHTADLRDLEPGTRVWAEGPSGTFTAAHRVRERALLIAGGSGITPDPGDAGGAAARAPR